MVEGIWSFGDRRRLEIGQRAKHHPSLCNFDRGQFMSGGRLDLCPVTNDLKAHLRDV